MRALRRAYAQARRLAGDGRARRGARHRAPSPATAPRSRRSRRVFARPGRDQPAVRDRLGQVDDRPHEGDGRGRRADQGRARAAPPGAAADDRRRRAQPERADFDGVARSTSTPRPGRGSAAATATRAAPASAPSASAAPTSTSCSRSTPASTLRERHERRSTAWPAELLLWRGDSRARSSTPSARSAPSCAAAPSRRWPTSRTRSPPRPAAGRRRNARDRRRLARGAARGSSTPRRPRSPATRRACTARRRPLRGAPARRGRQGRLPVPGPGLAVRDMGRELAVVFPEVPSSSSAATACSPTCTSSRSAATSSRLPSSTKTTRSASRPSLTDTHVAQPALGAMDLGCLHVLRSFGVEPEIVAGHSYGEFVALAAAGSISEDDLLLLSEARGRFIREEAGEEPGSMAAIEARARRARRAAGGGRRRDRERERAAADRRLGLARRDRGRGRVVHASATCARGGCRSPARSTRRSSSRRNGGSRRCCARRSSRRRGSPSTRTRRPRTIPTIRRRSRRSSASI